MLKTRKQPAPQTSLNTGMPLERELKLVEHLIKETEPMLKQRYTYARERVEVVHYMRGLMLLRDSIVKNGNNVG